MFKQVFKDTNGRTCLRVDQSPLRNGPTKYIMLYDGVVGVHTLPYQDFHDRFSADMKNYDIARAAKLLLQPLSKEVKVTEEARKILAAIERHPDPIYPAPIPLIKTEDTKMETATNVQETTKGRKKVTTKAAPTKQPPVKVNGKKTAAKAPKVKKEKKAAAVRGPRGVDPSTKIKVLVKKNPKRESSSAYGRFELYFTNKTVGEFLAAGGTTGDLQFDQKAEFIQLG